jgi:hypothetical protein
MYAGPVAVVVTPGYPTSLAVGANPALLARHLPANWQQRELAALAGALLAAGAAGCEQTRMPTTAGSGTHAKLAPGATAIVAPVFRHGEGLALTGCVVAARHAYLTEDEALALIADELRPYGIDLSQRDVPLRGARVPHATEDCYDWVGRTRAYRPTQWSHVKATGLDPQHRVAVTFSSRDDYYHVAGPWHERVMGTAYRIETKAVADYFAAAVQGQRAGVYFGAFYDPLLFSPTPIDYPALCELQRKGRSDDPDSVAEAERVQAMWKRTKRMTEEEARDALRAQVRDFIDWLKAQGVI